MYPKHWIRSTEDMEKAKAWIEKQVDKVSFAMLGSWNRFGNFYLRINTSLMARTPSTN